MGFLCQNACNPVLLIYSGSMPITDGSKERLKLRLAKATGHLNAVNRMVDEKKYCIDVLHQLKAVQAALDKISEEILKQHLETCVVEAIRNQDERRVIDELIQVFRKAPDLNLEIESVEAVFHQNGCCH